VSFLSPLALLGLLFVPVVLAMYLLKLRRDERVVPSTLLWQRLLTDVEANAPWQRLRRSLLLLLQLLLVALLAILAARPFLERPAGLAGDVVVVIDTSASMGATDIPPDRLTEAKAQVLARLHDLPANGTVSVIAAGRTARVVVNGTTDIGRVRAAIDEIKVSPSTGDLGDALNLANALAARAGDAEILVATDAALAIKPTAQLDHKVSVVQVGRERRNQAIVALAVRPAASGVTRSVFVSIANLDIEPAGRTVQLYADDILIEAKDLPNLEPQTRTEVVIDDVPRGASVIEVRLVALTGSNGAAADSLTVDDRAWAIVPPDRVRRVLLVGPGDPYLETALSYLPSTELYGVTPDKYGRDTHTELFDMIIFEGFLPPELPRGAILAIAPPASSPLGEVIGTLSDPGIATLPTDDPILKFVDLSSVHVGKAAKLALPAWARSVIPGPAGAPLLYAGDRGGGQRAAVMAFLPRNSDLPLQVAFPVLMSNLAGELMGGAATPADALRPGDPISIPVPAGATAIKVTRPDGTVVELAPATEDAATVAFSQTDELGVYSAVPVFAAATPGPSGASLTPIATATRGSSTSPATPAPGASSTPVPTAPPVDPNAPVRFAVDLFDVNESDIAPGSPSSITVLGRQSGAPATPGPSGDASPAGSVAPAPSGVAGGGTAEERPAARDELWVLVVLVVLVVLLAEWLVYHRDAVTRLWRGARRRPAEAASGPSKAGR
jgi:hypothetical protein